MAKFTQILFVAFLAFALCSAEAARNSRHQGRRNRFLARQEVEDVTPYPSADELKPVVPFNEAVAGEEQTPFQPDEVYGPPEQDVAVETGDFVPVQDEVADEEAVVFAEEEAPARLTARRGAFRTRAVRPAKLRKAAPARLQLQRQFVPQPFFYYIAQ